ncbi:MAG: hypothetical protein ACKOD3_07030, partial [Phenylobacterium sp.]
LALPSPGQLSPVRRRPTADEIRQINAALAALEHDPAATEKVSGPYSGSPAFMGIALVDGALDEPLMVAYPDAFSADQG